MTSASTTNPLTQIDSDDDDGGNYPDLEEQQQRIVQGTPQRVVQGTQQYSKIRSEDDSDEEDTEALDPKTVTLIARVSDRLRKNTADIEDLKLRHATTQDLDKQGAVMQQETQLALQALFEQFKADLQYKTRKDQAVHCFGIVWTAQCMCIMIIGLLILIGLVFAGLFIAASWYFTLLPIYQATRPTVVTAGDLGIMGSATDGHTNANLSYVSAPVASLRFVNSAPNNITGGVYPGWPSVTSCVRRNVNGTVDNEETCLLFNTSSQGVPVTSLYLSSNGSVGIGTENPWYTLDVNGSAKIRGTLIMGSNSTIDFIDPSRIRSDLNGLTLSALLCTMGGGGSCQELPGIRIKPDGSVYSGNFTAGSMNVTGTLSVTNFVVGTALTVSQTLSGVLTVGGMSFLNGGLTGTSGTFSGPVTANDGITVNGLPLTSNTNIYGAGNLTIAGPAALGGTTVNGNLTVTGSFVATTFTFTQGVTVNQNINGTLIVSGLSTLNGGFLAPVGTVTGLMTMSGGFFASGYNEINGTLAVNTLQIGQYGSSTFGARAVFMNTSGTVTGTIDSATGNADFVGGLTVSGLTATSGLITGNLQLGQVGAPGNLVVVSTGGFITTTLFSTGAATLGGTTTWATGGGSTASIVASNGNALFAGTTAWTSGGNIGGGITASVTASSGAASFVTVAGTTSISTPIAIIGGGLQSGSHAFTVNGVNGADFVGGPVHIGGTLNVDGASQFGTTTTVGSGSPISGAFTIYNVALFDTGMEIISSNGAAHAGLYVGNYDPSYAAIPVGGDAYVTGTVHYGGLSMISTQQVKQNITQLNATIAQTVVMGLQGVTYYNTPGYQQILGVNQTMPKPGLIAEAVANITSQFYGVTSMGTIQIAPGVFGPGASVSFDALFPFLLVQVQTLTTQIAALQQRFNACNATAQC